MEMKSLLTLVINSSVDDYLLKMVFNMVTVIDLTKYLVCILTDLKPIQLYSHLKVEKGDINREETRDS